MVNKRLSKLRTVLTGHAGDELERTKDTERAQSLDVEHFPVGDVRQADADSTAIASNT